MIQEHSLPYLQRFPWRSNQQDYLFYQTSKGLEYLEHYIDPQGVLCYQSQKEWLSKALNQSKIGSQRHCDQRKQK